MMANAPLIDVHYIYYDEPEWQITRCLESLRGEPVTVHSVPGVWGNPPVKKRAEGFALGTAPYVSYVDPDDYVEPGVYTRLLQAITSGDFDAAYGWERVFSDSGINRVCKIPHHAFLLKRNLPIEYGQAQKVFMTLPRKRVVEVEDVLYHRDLGQRHG